jgi:hypothetical protein
MAMTRIPGLKREYREFNSTSLRPDQDRVEKAALILLA